MIIRLVGFYVYTERLDGGVKEWKIFGAHRLTMYVGFFQRALPGFLFHQALIEGRVYMVYGLFDLTLRILGDCLYMVCDSQCV